MLLGKGTLRACAGVARSENTLRACAGTGCVRLLPFACSACSLLPWRPCMRMRAPESCLQHACAQAAQWSCKEALQHGMRLLYSLLGSNLLMSAPAQSMRLQQQSSTCTRLLPLPSSWS